MSNARVSHYEFTADLKKRADDIRALYPVGKAALLPILHLLQEEWGFIPQKVEEEVAAYLGIPCADVREVMTFYTLFNSKPVGKCHIQLCRTLSCSLLGADDLIAHIKETLGLVPGQMTEDGMFSFETVECLGACEIAPMAQINQRYVGPLTKEKLTALIEDFKNKQEKP